MNEPVFVADVCFLSLVKAWELCPSLDGEMGELDKHAQREPVWHFFPFVVYELFLKVWISKRKGVVLSLSAAATPAAVHTPQDRKVRNDKVFETCDRFLKSHFK